MSYRGSIDGEAPALDVTQALLGGSGSGRPSGAGMRSRNVSAAGVVLEKLKAHWWVRDTAALKEIFLSSWVNVLLVTVPVGIYAGAVGWPATWVFVLVRFWGPGG